MSDVSKLDLLPLLTVNPHVNAALTLQYRFRKQQMGYQFLEYPNCYGSISLLPYSYLVHPTPLNPDINFTTCVIFFFIFYCSNMFTFCTVWTDQNITGDGLSEVVWLVIYSYHYAVRSVIYI